MDKIVIRRSYEIDWSSLLSL